MRQLVELYTGFKKYFGYEAVPKKICARLLGGSSGSAKVPPAYSCAVSYTIHLRTQSTTATFSASVSTGTCFMARFQNSAKSGTHIHAVASYFVIPIEAQLAFPPYFHSTL